jgi:hypothetical protein
MQNRIPTSTELIPSPQELRHRLALALREVDLLRRLIRVAEHAARIHEREDECWEVSHAK